jgi:Uma2 family endonuclease
VKHLNQSVSKEIPILENGDRLTRAEFERRYQPMSNVKKAELVEGIVYMPSPVRIRKHSNPHGRIMTWLGVYEAATPSVMLGDNPTVRLDIDNEPQPDAMLRLEESVGGTSQISEDDYIEGSPELIVEIASSSASYDLYDKREAYRRNGVREYLVWLVEDQELRWYIWEEGSYQQQPLKESGIIKSPFFLGLWLNVSALLRGEMQQVLATLNSGLESQEHQRFVEQLQERKNH